MLKKKKTISFQFVQCSSSVLAPVSLRPRLLNTKPALIGQLTHTWASTANNNRAAVLHQFLRVKVAKRHKWCWCVTLLTTDEVFFCWCGHFLLETSFTWTTNLEQCSIFRLRRAGVIPGLGAFGLRHVYSTQSALCIVSTPIDSVQTCTNRKFTSGQKETQTYF